MVVVPRIAISPLTENLASLLLAGLVGAVVSALVCFALIRRRTRSAFEDGLQRQAERANADHQLLEERLDARTRESIRLDQALKTTAQSLDASEEDNRA